MTLRSLLAIENLRRLSIGVGDLLGDISANRPLSKGLLFESVCV